MNALSHAFLCLTLTKLQSLKNFFYHIFTVYVYNAYFNIQPLK